MAMPRGFLICLGRAHRSFRMSTALEWTEDFAVGHEAVDRQHRLLVASINEIDETIRAQDEPKVAQLLKVLRLAAEEHFREENALLWQILTGT
jgi:hemerythrin-like metal-binding protein